MLRTWDGTVFFEIPNTSATSIFDSPLDTSWIISSSRLVRTDPIAANLFARGLDCSLRNNAAAMPGLMGESPERALFIAPINSIELSLLCK